MYYSEIDTLTLMQEYVAQAQDVLCEYRSPQFDGGTQQGRMIQCRNKAAMWTDRGLRCTDHKED